MDHHPPDLHVSKTHSSSVIRLSENSWSLEIPAGNARQYRLAQLDEHSHGRRTDFCWRPPLMFSLKARVSSDDLPGTWGFGLWNDPFSFLLGYEGVVLRLPALPEAAWFFHASSHNYLSLRDDLPATGFMAGTFNSVKIPPALVTLAAPILALSFIPGAAQWIRKLLRNVVRQDSVQLSTQETGWHTYTIHWDTGQVTFSVDEVEVLKTTIIPRGPLSLVIWIDNQYAALPPSDRLRYGYLLNPVPAWLEIEDVVVLDQA